MLAFIFYKHHCVTELLAWLQTPVLKQRKGARSVQTQPPPEPSSLSCWGRPALGGFTAGSWSPVFFSDWFHRTPGDAHLERVPSPTCIDLLTLFAQLVGVSLCLHVATVLPYLKLDRPYTDLLPLQIQVYFYYTCCRYRCISTSDTGVFILHLNETPWHMHDISICLMMWLLKPVGCTVNGLDVSFERRWIHTNVCTQ